MTLIFLQIISTSSDLTNACTALYRKENSSVNHTRTQIAKTATTSSESSHLSISSVCRSAVIDDVLRDPDRKQLVKLSQEGKKKAKKDAKNKPSSNLLV